MQRGTDGRKTRRFPALVAAVPALPAAALSADSLTASAPRPGVARLLIAADFNDDLAALGPRTLAARLAPFPGPEP